MIAEDVYGDDMSGEQLRELREMLNMDQGSMGRYIGVTRMTINRIERGHSKPDRHIRLTASLLLREIRQRGSLRDWPQVY